MIPAGALYNAFYYSLSLSILMANSLSLNFEEIIKVRFQHVFSVLWVKKAKSASTDISG